MLEAPLEKSKYSRIDLKKGELRFCFIQIEIAHIYSMQRFMGIKKTKNGKLAILLSG